MVWHLGRTTWHVLPREAALKEGSDTKGWVLIVVVAAAAVFLSAAFFWYLDSVGRADGPNEGAPTHAERMTVPKVV
jgi:hypothetical protein